MRKTGAGDTIIHVLLILWAILQLYPVVWLASSSLKPTDEILSRIWNEFLFSLVIMKNNHAKTLPVGLMSFRGPYNADWGPMLAAMFMATIPSLLFYFIFHRKIISGISAGSLKE